MAAAVDSPPLLPSPSGRWIWDELTDNFPRNTYNLVSRNCNHFCNAACRRLVSVRIPRWVNRLAKIGRVFTCVIPGNGGKHELLSTRRELDIDIVLLAGYMKLIPTELISEYPGSILNIHPSLLPAFGGKGYYGLRVHKAVIASGARYSGPTVYFVDDHYDTGRTLAQRVVPVLANDTPELLASRVFFRIRAFQSPFHENINSR